jgi:hypothetical protein
MTKLSCGIMSRPRLGVQKSNENRLAASCLGAAELVWQP